MPVLPDRSKDSAGNPIAGSIQAPATNLTLGGVTLAGATTVIAGWRTLFEQIFGTTATEGTRKDVLIASIVAFAVIVAADLFSRAITTAAAERSKRAEAAGSRWVVVTAPAGLSATLLEGQDEGGYRVAALRTRGNASQAIEYLIIKEDKAPTWKAASALKFE